MSLKQMKKSELQDLSKQLGLGDIGGTKAVIEDKINAHFDLNPELEMNPQFNKFFVYRKKSSPVKSTPSKRTSILLSSAKSVLATPTRGVVQQPTDDGEESDEEEDDDEEEEEEEEEDDDDDDNEKVSDSNSDDDAVVEIKRSFEEKKENYFAKYKDILVEKYDIAKSKGKEVFAESVDSLAETSLYLRDSLSQPTSITNAELILEYLYIVTHFIPIKTVKQNVPAAIVKYLPAKIQTLPSFEIKEFLRPEFLQLVAFWFTISVIVPTVASYYINFNRYGLKYDPFTFFVTRLLLNFIFLGKTVDLEDVKEEAAVAAARATGLDIGLTFVDYAKDFALRNSVKLRYALGLLPFFGSSIGLLISFYVATNASI